MEDVIVTPQSKTYHVTGIKNEIEWDGENAPRPLRLRGSGYLKPDRGGKSRRKIRYYLHTEDMKATLVSETLIHFMLRTGLSLEQCRKHNVMTVEGGVLYDRNTNAKGWSSFNTLSECRETLDILENILRGNEAPFIEYMMRNREYVQNLLKSRFNIGYEKSHRFWDEALDATIVKLRTFSFKAIRKMYAYFMSEMFNICRNSEIPFNDRLKKKVL